MDSMIKGLEELVVCGRHGTCMANLKTVDTFIWNHHLNLENVDYKKIHFFIYFSVNDWVAYQRSILI